MVFFPKADAAVLSSNRSLPPSRPQTVGPIFDSDGFPKPVEAWSLESHEANYPQNADLYAPASIPDRPTCASDRYLRATLAKNERLRLSMLWYYTRDILNELELLSGLQEKVHLAQESTDWEFAVIGLLDINYYTRLATVGLPLGILPRGETICAHTVTQPPGSVFLMPNMLEDWRFKDSPYVESGGLLAYAGAPLRLQSESGETVGLGSLCVASSTKQDPLTKTQQRALAHLADWIVSDLVQSARVRRQRERRQMTELLAAAQAEMDDSVCEEPILNILRVTYPESVISVKSAQATHLEVEGREPLLLADLEDGVWEDTDYIDDFIATSNCLELPTTRAVRVLTAKFESTSGPSLLAVASNDFRLVFDDIDLWFVQTCASIISQVWHKRLLNEAIKAKDKFLRGFSHQLRTPIHGILGSVELLAEELMSRNTLLEAVSASTSAANSGTPYVYLDTIKTSGRDLISIVNSMITLNRWAEIAVAERSYATHALQELEADLADETRKMFSGDSRYQPSIFFSHSPLLHGHSLRADHNLLRDSILPLVVNAIQNTPEGIVRVTISLDADSRELTVDIEDTGRGIHPEHQGRIFEPYEKVGEHSTGAGLGLTLASKFAALLNGSVDLVSSTVGRGSHFRAIFREIECLPATLAAQSLVPELDHLPSRFHYMPCASDRVSPCDYFTTLLTRQGFTSSDTMDDSFLIIDHVSDLEQRRQYLSQIPPTQVAICLSPAADEQGSPDQSTNNLIYIHGPFDSSAITSALAEADRLIAEIREPRSDLINSSPPPLTIEEVSNLDAVVESLSKTNLAESQQIDLAEADAVDPASKTKLAPTAMPNPVPPPTEPSTATPAVPALKPSTPTALLVDDNAINLRVMQMYCQKRKIPYLSAADGKQAVDMFLQHQQLAAAGEGAAIQLVLMDLQMPVCDGLEATRQIRALEKQHNWKESTLYIVTGQDTPSDRVSAKDAGADDFLVKPVSVKLLDLRIRHVLPELTGI